MWRVGTFRSSSSASRCSMRWAGSCGLRRSARTSSGCIPLGSPAHRRSVLRLLLLLLGLLTLIALIGHVGPARILDTTAGLGLVPLVVILLPSVLMYALEAWGWRMTLGRHADTVSFSRLFAIRTAGEVVNMTTPTAYVGGEPL